MNKKLIFAGVGSIAVLLPFGINEYINSKCPELSKEIITKNSANALPSFARQTGYSCNTCHTIPPRLNKFGMMFKMKGYTEGKSLDEIMVGDNHTIPKYNPLSIRVLSFPYSKQKGESNETIFPSEFMLAFAGRISENFGGVLEPIYEAEEGKWGIEYARATYVQNIGKNILLGLIGGWTSPTGTDPFISLDYHGRRLTRSIATPHIALKNTGLQDIFSFNNRGISAYGYFSNLVYLNIGAYRGNTSLTNENIGLEEAKINQSDKDPIDFYSRIALTKSIFSSDLNIGGFYYSGKDNLQNPDGSALSINGIAYEKDKPQRVGIDFGVQKYFKNGLMFELLGLYMSGKDKISTINNEISINHNGWNLAGTLYVGSKWGFSVIYGVYKFNDDNPLTDGNENGLERQDTTLHVSYMIRPNIRIGAEYQKTDYSGSSDYESTYLTSLIFDFAY